MANKNVTVTPVDPKDAPTLPKTTAPVKTIPKPGQKGDAELPVVRPGGDAQTMEAFNTGNGATGTENTQTGYTTQNDLIWGGGGSGSKGYYDYADQLKQGLNPNGTGSLSYEEYLALLSAGGDAEYKKWLAEHGSDADKYTLGGYNQDGNGMSTVLPGTGEEGWFYDEGDPRNRPEGTAHADEDLLSAEGYAYIQFCKQMYEQAETPEEKQYWHNEAERTRAGSGYSGGADGSMHIPLALLGVDTGTKQNLPDLPASDASGSGSSDSSPEAQMQALLEQWKAVALEQSNGQIDYAVAQAIKELERALEDAQPQFKETAESISIDERQAMDNAALYAELRGDKGGIGQEQYSSIQNTAAQNRLAVQQAQTKLSTDTARQIEDLRAQGEFEKADKALEITQAYLSQLISLEQWAAEFNLTQEQFQASLQQWEAEYQMAMQQLQISQEQWREEMDLNKIVSNFEMQLAEDQYKAALEQWQKEFDYNKQQSGQDQAAQVGYALLEAGRIDQITDAQLSAMGFTREQAQAYYDAMAAQNLTTAQSAAYKDVLAKAKAFETAEEANRYLSQMVAGGYITEQERSYIHSVVLGQNRPLVSETDGNWGEGYGTHVGTGSYKGTEWGAVKNTILSNLRTKNFDAVTSYMDQIAGGLSYEQFEELMALFEEYQYNPYSAVN